MQENFGELWAQALKRRESLFKSLKEEGTNAWRCFHGTVEGRPGLTVDRYGPHLLALVFFDELLEEERLVLAAYAQAEGLRLSVWDRRLEGGYEYKEFSDQPSIDQSSVDQSSIDSSMPEQSSSWEYCLEQGQRFFVDAKPRARAKAMDPYFYLDFRVVRRWLRSHVRPGQTVLNLFSYTCTAGVAACSSGAHTVNVDFGRWCMAIGQRNFLLNDIPENRYAFWNEDAFPILWQLSGISVKGRAAAKRYLRVKKQSFDVVVLDPPTIAKSRFGKVDIVNDYPSLLKPCLLFTNPGGVVIAANHSADVELTAWLKQIERTAEKCKVGLSSIEVLTPDSDFPSPDGVHPLKLALITIASD